MTRLLLAPADELPCLLFQPLIRTVGGDEIERAIAKAGGRWPILQPSLVRAAGLVRARGVYETTAESRDLALVKPPTAETFLVISPSPTGLACTRDRWPPLARAGPGDGLFCAHILAYLLALYLELPSAPLPFSPEELWQLTLEELRLQMTRASFHQWLLGSVIVPEASTPLSLTVAVRHRYAQEWLTHRLHALIVRTLVRVAGYEVQVRFLVL